MEIEQLQYFKTVATMQHMTRAAEVLAISQPALSKSIANIEQHLGVPLFNREGRSIYLNRFGELFLQSVNVILDEYDRIKEEFEDIIKPGSGEVSFGFIHTLGMEIVPELIASTSEAFPNMQFSLTQATSLSLLKRLEEGAIDLCLSQKIESRVIEIETEELFVEELFVIVPTTHPLAQQDAVKYDEVKNEPFIAIKKGNSLRQLVDELFLEQGIVLNTTFAAEEMHTVAGFVGAGMGISVIPNIKGLDHYKVKRLKLDPPCYRSVCVSWAKNRYLPPAASEFKQYLLQYFQQREE
ncbi:DNA-binding transcriptional LysR family regulator [Solibacillus kalamii]|uniref:Transcriptional regulator n=3 Tax=Solibacillus TaxID=648800 RepID=F2F7E0_SOLSS|nr:MULTISPECIES: LysR family transcriptional regulator [Solibacillus]AMO87104.1 LysR family transcriptional regulator [Solibacillus silvestris]EKB43628.1 HTH-type transcriptional regulator gltC [Solibacillus isronensis B3W22]MBM7667206.1 DNA-binding transcriptional LysR family regulator [Solibacillus kalamii]OUZ37360.1 LysR family transcriptional regulator [Solibacillus kalamii]BAK14865.1 transcriptional regulator [Solibacillus silvestris StLB046]